MECTTCYSVSMCQHGSGRWKKLHQIWAELWWRQRSVCRKRTEGKEGWQINMFPCNVTKYHITSLKWHWVCIWSALTEMWNLHEKRRKKILTLSDILPWNTVNHYGIISFPSFLFFLFLHVFKFFENQQPLFDVLSIYIILSICILYLYNYKWNTFLKDGYHRC